MAIFIYKAKRGSSETVTGQVSADNQEEAVELIHELGLLPISVEMQDVSDVSRLKKRGVVKLKEQYHFSRQLSNLIKSGVTLSRALNIVEEQTENKFFQRVIQKIGWDVRNGMSLSESMRQFPNIFSTLFVTMVAAGEESSHLYEVLLEVSAHQKRQHEILSKIKTATTYPCVMAFVGLATIVFIFTFVLPRMEGLFTNLGNQLPLPTIVLLKVSEVFSRIWWLVCAVVFGGAAIFYKWVQTRGGQAWLESLLMGVPVLGQIILKIELSRFCRTFVLLLNGGVSIVKSLEITIPLLRSQKIQKQLNICKEELIHGGAFGEGLRKAEGIPKIVGHLISVGEETGSLEEVLTDIANEYDQETEEQIKVLTTIFEPMMILVVGAIIGFIVFAMLLPVFQVDALIT